MHLFFHTILIIVKVLMRITMFLTREKTNYLNVPPHIISKKTADAICRIGHALPSMIVSIIIGVKMLPDVWPYYAKEFENNGEIITVIICLLFIPVAVINGIVIEKMLSIINPEYASYKNSLRELND